MKKQSLFKSFYRSIIVLFSAFIFIAIFFNALLAYISFVNEKNKMIEEIINAKKTIMKNDVDFFVSDIESSRKKLQEKTKKELKKRVDMAYNIAQNLYEKHKHDSNIQSIIVESLRELKFYDIGDQYVFMTKLDGTFLLVAGLKHLEGKNVFNLTTESNKVSIRNIINMVKAKKEGFYTYKWQNQFTLKLDEKISYVKYFKPFDCYIGTGVFTNDIDEKLKDTFIERISSFRFGDNMTNYIFAGTYDGISLTYPAKNKNVYEVTDVNGLKVVQELIKTAKHGSGFVRYVVPIGEDKSLEKISYVVGIDKWNMYVGFGETLKEINKIIKTKKEELFIELSKDIALTLTLGIIFLILFYYIYKKTKNSVIVDMENFIQSISKLLSDNKEIDIDKIKYTEFEQISKQTNQLLKNKIEVEHTLKEKEAILFQQSKMAAMGELLENIAHQWRQPLSLIMVSSTGIQAKKKYGHLDDEFLEESLENINANAEYLSNTIDDFRNFFIESVQKEYFKMNYIIDKTLKLIYLRDKDNKVTFINNINAFEIHSYKNQLIQALIVIVNNAYDAFENYSGDKKFIFIDITKDDQFVYISIRDNAGGIAAENLDKIFEPYFTTKYKSKGTGIGLYMARELITKQLKGEIVATTEIYTYQNQEYTGAKFLITFPINI